MREDICSIPISEIFEPKDGCPFCRMRDMLEDRMATYITGAAMMEPDVRIETNRQGFCKDHFAANAFCVFHKECHPFKKLAKIHPLPIFLPAS